MVSLQSPAIHHALNVYFGVHHRILCASQHIATSLRKYVDDEIGENCLHTLTGIFLCQYVMDLKTGSYIYQLVAVCILELITLD